MGACSFGNGKRGSGSIEVTAVSCPRCGGGVVTASIDGATRMVCSACKAELGLAPRPPKPIRLTGTPAYANQPGANANQGDSGQSNLIFLLGIWAGIGLCAACFTFLGTSGRLVPLLRWLEGTAHQEASPPADPTKPAPTSSGPQDAENTSTKTPPKSTTKRSRRTPQRNPAVSNALDATAGSARVRLAPAVDVTWAISGDG
jgi:ribosomal protein S27AE